MLFQQLLDKCTSNPYCGISVVIEIHAPLIIGACIQLFRQICIAVVLLIL